MQIIDIGEIHHLEPLEGLRKILIIHENEKRILIDVPSHLDFWDAYTEFYTRIEAVWLEQAMAKWDSRKAYKTVWIVDIDTGTHKHTFYSKQKARKFLKEEYNMKVKDSEISEYFQILNGLKVRTQEFFLLKEKEINE